MSKTDIRQRKYVCPPAQLDSAVSYGKKLCPRCRWRPFPGVSWFRACCDSVQTVSLQGGIPTPPVSEWQASVPWYRARILKVGVIFFHLRSDFRTKVRKQELKAFFSLR